MKFRKKPIVIEAFRVPARGKPIEGAPPLWLLSALAQGTVSVCGPPADGLLVHTLEGQMRGEVGDWIIQGVKGELYPCKDDIFAATYQQADSEPLERQHPMPCWCPYCGEPHSPAVRETRERESQNNGGTGS